MIYNEDIHKKIMEIHDPNKKWRNLLTGIGATLIIISLIMFLPVMLTPTDEMPKDIFEFRKSLNFFGMLVLIILGVFLCRLGSRNRYRNLCTILFRKGIIIGEFDPEIKKYILDREETSSYKKTQLKENLDEFIEECEELAPEYRKEALYLRMKKWIEIEIPEIIEEDTEFEKNKFEEYKAKHGFSELELEKEKN